MTNVLITGAGMVGCHAARLLADHGHHVTLLDVAPREDYVRAVAGGDVHLMRGDIAELPPVIEAVGSAHAEVVVHTAALIGNAAQVDPYRGFRVNVAGSVNVAEAVRLLGVRRLVHASTLGTNDLSRPQTGPLTEDFPLGSGGRVYGASKVAAEQLLRAWSRAHRFELVMLRFAGVYGFGHFAGGSGVGREIDAWLRAALAGRPGRLTGGLPDPFEIVHATDVARAIVLAVEIDRAAHDTYNIGTGSLVRPADVVAAIARLVPGFALADAGSPRDDPFPRRFPFDLSRSRAELGYEPSLGLDEGLADVLASVRGDQAAGESVLDA